MTTCARALLVAAIVVLATPGCKNDECESRADCGWLYVCIEGQCVPESPCGAGYGCPLEYVCYRGACVINVPPCLDRSNPDFYNWPDDIDLEPLLEFVPTWCIVARDEEDLYLVQGSELLNWLSQRVDPEATTDLTEADIRRWTIAPVPVQATLRQAVDTMRSATVEAVSVYERSASSGNLILHGVVTREGIEKHYLARL